MLHCFLSLLAVIDPGFTKMVSSVWAMTLLSLYIRVQVNILGRHLYIDTARGLGISQLLVRAILFLVKYFQTAYLPLDVVVP